MVYLLDTNIVSDMMRDPDGKAARQFAHTGQREIAISIIVAAELRYGVLRSGAIGLRRAAEGLLKRITVVPFDEPADKFYAEIRLQLERAGTPIGSNDTLIAAHALALDCTLVSGNEREFRRVKGLKVENWLR